MQDNTVVACVAWKYERNNDITAKSAPRGPEPSRERRVSWPGRLGQPLQHSGLVASWLAAFPHSTWRQL